MPAASVHPVPANVPPARAILAANLETALNGIWDAHVAPGDRVTVIGGGSVGCLVAWLAGRIPGCDVELVDLNPQQAFDCRAAWRSISHIRIRRATGRMWCYTRVAHPKGLHWQPAWPDSKRRSSS